jgi:hypothetical protein
VYSNQCVMEQNGRIALAFVLALFITMVLGMFPEVAWAQYRAGQNIGQVSQNITNSLRGVNVVIQAFCYVLAAVMIVLAIMKFKANSDNPNQVPMKIPMIYLGVAGGLAAAPEVLSTMIATLFGGSAETVRIQ